MFIGEKSMGLPSHLSYTEAGIPFVLKWMRDFIGQLLVFERGQK